MNAFAAGAGYAVSGLTPHEVMQSRKQYGENRITKQKRKSFWQQYAASFGDPVIKILLIVLAINFVVMLRNFDWYETAGIALSILLATTISTVSEYGSESAFLTLQADAEKIKCRVKRSTGIMEVYIHDIVVGDLVLLQAGERIPADGLIIAGKITADQSALNGETKETLKIPGDESPAKWDLATKNQVFHGATVITGEGLMRVITVGDATIYGGMAKQMQEETRESPLKFRLTKLTSTLSKLGYLAAALVFFADLFSATFLYHDFDMAAIQEMVTSFSELFPALIHSLMLGVTVIVVSVPEGLPMMITVVLSANMKRMLKDQVLVRKLVGIETSGSLNILFTDKTGTLTQGKLQVSAFIAGDGTDYGSFSKLKNHPALEKLVSLSGVYNTASVYSNGRIIGGNSTDSAMLSYVSSTLSHMEGYDKSHVVPFDSDYKFSSVHIAGQGEALNLVKGAPELLLPACTHYYDENGAVRPLTRMDALKTLWRERTRSMERVLALAVSPTVVTERSGFAKLTLIGLVSIHDEIRPDAPTAVEQIRQAGIQVVMVTGDNKETATAIAKKIGLLDEGGAVAMTSDEMSALCDEEVQKLLPRLRVVARALPTDKSRLVRIAQDAGLVVGMTGDGINDAPALKKADIGFAMGTGTEVAKEAGDIVILNNNISAICKAILYGRTVFKNIRKFIVFQLTMNLCAVGVSLAGPFMGIDTPVTVIQMLWINMIMDTLGGLAFSGEAPLEEYMQEPPKRRDEPILSPYMKNQIIVTGGFTMVLCILFLNSEFLRRLFHYEETPLHLLTAFFALFIFCGVFNSCNARTHRLKLFSGLRKNPLFGGIMLMIVCIQILMIYFGGDLFRTVGLTLPQLLLVIGTAFLVVPVDTARKQALKLLHKPRSY